MFKTYRDKKNIDSLGKNPHNYESVCNETSVYEQKPTKIDDFNDAEEKEVKEHVQKRKKKEEKLLKINLLKKKKQQENKKKNEKEKRNQLKELNQEFKDIKEHKKKV